MPGIDSYTKLMLHMNGTDGSTTFTDSSDSAHAVTANGDAQIDTAQSKFGGASGLFDGNGDYLTVPDSDDWYLGSGDFTIDLWVYIPFSGSTYNMFGQYVDVNNYFQGYVTWSMAVYILARSAGTNIYNISTDSYVISENTWTHLAFVRSGGATEIYIDGVASATGNTESTLPNYSAVLNVGDYGGNLPFKGNIDEFRWSKGIARWTSDFTPPTSEYDDTPEPYLMNCIRSRIAFPINRVPPHAIVW